MSNKKVTLDVARQLMDACYAKAKELEVKVVMSVSNEHGDLIAFNRMEGAFLVSTEISINKAWTVVALKMPTSRFAELVLPGQELYGMENTNNHKLITLGGGIPLFDGDEVVGGIGVSGSSAELDAVVAQAGVDLFNKMN